MGSPAFPEGTLCSRGPLTLHRSQSVDLGYDLRALALQRGKPSHEFSNSGVRLLHREDSRAPMFILPNNTNPERAI